MNDQDKKMLITKLKQYEKQNTEETTQLFLISDVLSEFYKVNCLIKKVDSMLKLSENKR